MRFFGLLKKRVPQESKPVILKISVKAQVHIEAECAEQACLAMIKHYNVHGSDEQWSADAALLLGKLVKTMGKRKEVADD